VTGERDDGYRSQALALHIDVRTPDANGRDRHRPL